MHPPLLKSIARRRQVQRFRSCTEGKNSTTRKKGQHQCPICKGYGHHWHNCKEGDPDTSICIFVCMLFLSLVPVFFLKYSFHVDVGDHQRRGKGQLQHQQRKVLFHLMTMS
jgi:hypothetical protein